MKRVFLIGEPITHSLSPAMHNAAFHAIGFAAQYELLETPPAKLRDAVARVRADDCLGANVTTPHKASVIELLDEVSEIARTIGSVNTLFKHAGKLIGTSTDGAGFMHALRDEQIEVRNARVVILGAGGAARAVAFALSQAQIASLTILNRTRARAEILAEHLRAHSPIPISVNAAHAIAQATLIVNATPAGTLPPATTFPRDAVVFDLVYRHTDLLRAAERAGARTLNGLGMLVHQGALAFTLWTGHAAPLEVMFRAVRS